MNLAHLFLGTQLDNVRDMANKGRARKARGTANGNAKLTADEVAAIRVLYGRLAAARIGELFGVSQTQVSLIQRGENWGHT